MQQPSSLFDIILKQNFSGLASKDYLQQVAGEHPYFTPAQFYLLQQTKPTDSNYDEQAAKTAVLFNNPYWLNFKLQQNNKPDIFIKETPVVAMYAENSDNNNDTEFVREKIITESLVADNNPDNDDDTAALVSITETAEPLPIEENAHTDDDNAVVAKENINTQPLQFGKKSEHDDDNAALVNPSKIEESIPVIKNSDSNTNEPDTEQHLPPIKIDITSSLNRPADNALTFEPMHLVDYFASQGIKLSEEVQTADKLGKQLKSFSEWLKTMKKIHVPGSDPNSGQADIAIQTLAEKSNAEREIITEAMAEVFARQGKAGKAIELYQKLSLLNPLKSAYFAAKIDQLKGA